MGKYKKLIVPAIIALIVIGYFMSYFFILKDADMPSIMKYIIILFIIGLILGMGYVFFERVREIKGGEEDDISKY